MLEASVCRFHMSSCSIRHLLLSLWAQQKVQGNVFQLQSLSLYNDVHSGLFTYIFFCALWPVQVQHDGGLPPAWEFRGAC